MVDKSARRPSASVASLGDYDLLSEIQKDPFASLWAARHTSDAESGKLVLIRSVGVGDLGGELAEEVEQAVRWAVDLDHWAVLSVTEAVSADDQLGIVSPYIEGELLSVLLFRANLRRQHFPVAVVMRVALDLLEALGYLHGQEAPVDTYRYGALSPDNVLVGLDGRARILEPGVTAVLSQAKGWAEEPKRLAYRAPEQLGGSGDFGVAADVFTIGTIIWEMLGKRRLFPGSSADAVIENVLSQPIQRVDGLKVAGMGAITDKIATVVAQALERPTEERLHSVGALAGAIQAASETIGEHEATARYVDELQGQALLERHRKIERALAAAKPSGSGGELETGGTENDKSKVSDPGPFMAAPSSKGREDDGVDEDSPGAKQGVAMPGLTPGKGQASSRVLLGRKPLSPEAEARAAEPEAAPVQQSEEAESDKPKGAPPPPKRRAPAVPLADEPPPSRKESAVVTMPAPRRSQLTRRRRPSKGKAKAALPTSALKDKETRKGPPRRVKAAEPAAELEPKVPAEADEPDEDLDVSVELPEESAPEAAEGDAEQTAAEGAHEASESTDAEPDEADGLVSEPEAGQEPAGGAGEADEGKASAAKAEASAAKAGKPSEQPSEDAKASTQAGEAKDKAKAPAVDKSKSKSKPEAKVARPKPPAAAAATEPVAAEDGEPAKRWPIFAALAAVVVGGVLVLTLGSESDEEPTTPGSGTASARVDRSPPPSRTADPSPAASDTAAVEPPVPTRPATTGPVTDGAVSTATAAPTVRPTTEPKDPAPPETALTAVPPPPKTTPKPPPPKPPPPKPPPSKPKDEFDPGDI